MTQRPKVVLFDIGGVCVVSPFQAILDYEKKQNIPQGWINHAISASSPHGSWQRLERGEIPLDSTFFTLFHADLTNERVWKQYHLSLLRKQNKKAEGGPTDKDEAAASAQAAEEVLFNAPPPPDNIDAEWLYWEMMRISRAPDPHIYPALQRLRKRADALNSSNSGEGFIIGALSNTSIFPPGHEFGRADTPEGQFTARLRAHFDVFVSSAHVGMRKPDRDIYDYTVAQLDALARARAAAGRGGGGAGKEYWEDGVKARDIVFLDDIGGNLRTAREVGMRTIKVVLGQTEKAVRELEGVMGMDLSGVSSKL